MTHAIRCLSLLVITVMALSFITGCGKTEKAEPVNILFSQAQDLQQDEKYNDAIRTYKQIANKHKDSRLAANSQFMIGYIYANHLKDLEQAKIEFNRFLDNFSESADSGLIVGAKFELEYLGKSIEEIPILSTVGESDSITINEKATEEK